MYVFIFSFFVHEWVVGLKTTKTGKACGPDQIPIEVWKLLGDEGLD